MKKTVLYIGNFSFPLGNAAGKRVYANGKILRELGYEVIFIGMDKEVDSSLNGTKSEYEGFTFYNFPYPKRSMEWISYRKTFSDLIKFLNTEEIVNSLDLVIYYGSPTLSIFNMKLIRYCKRKKISVIADCVDWLTTKTNNPVFDLIKWADNTYQKAYVNKKADGVIAITNYLSDYYKKRGSKTVVIPPLSPIENLNSKTVHKKSDIKIITYAGLPFRKGQPVVDCKKLKDRIDKTVILLCKLKRKGVSFVFNIYGFTKEEYLIAIPSQKVFIEELGDSIIFNGHMHNEIVVERVSNSDFTILLRDINRDTTAGFPTKISESISCGTPVITTDTSDLGEYIVEGKNGFFIEIEDEEKASETLKNILEQKMEDILLMKNYCKNSKTFHYRGKLSQMAELIEKINE
ncbi:glycosyltransferase [Bacillaceae bacterium S4-13-56]